MKEPHFFGIRHLSPAGAFFLRKFLEEKKPKLVLIEGPEDFDDIIDDLVKKETKPPVAVLAYTKEVPVRTILYPFAEYSPEYQAICWSRENGAECRFIDLPSEVFLAIEEESSESKGEKESGEEENREEKRLADIYRRLDEVSKEDGHDTFWERVLEQAKDTEGYYQGANLFGKSLRDLEAQKINEGSQREDENALREAFMRKKIREAAASGICEDDIVVVTGAYHVEGLKSWRKEEKAKKLLRVKASHTLMPYSYYRLSVRSGYGAGNKAPAYYELLWEGMKRGKRQYAAYAYLSKIAFYQRANQTAVSSAQVIEAVRLAQSLAGMRGSGIPALRDLRDAAQTCLGEGNFASISLAAADTEIGTKIGILPEGVSRTSIQEDFYRRLRELKLERYRDLAAQDLKLDLRENRRASSKQSAFLDRNRSFFLHQLRVLGISFAKKQKTQQDTATWSEHWIAKWTPEAEIELVEAALKGDTVAQAASFYMKEEAAAAADMSKLANIIEDACFCGMGAAVGYAAAALQKMAVDAVSFQELASTSARLSSVIQYGDIRCIDSKPLIPILQQIFYRACLIFASSCVCDDAACKTMLQAINELNLVSLAHDFVDGEAWLTALEEVADRDDLNTKLSGFAAAILLERGEINSESLQIEVQRRLSHGVPAELGAGWFEGLAMKNRYALIARLSLWQSLDSYLAELSEEEFKRALVFLRRAFADFSSAQKDEIAENLGELWGLNRREVSEMLNGMLSEKELTETGLDGEKASEAMIDGLEDFDFDF